MRKFNFNFLVIFFKFNSINFNLNGFLYGQKVILQFGKIQLKLKRLILKKSEFFSLFFVIYFSKTGPMSIFRMVFICWHPNGRMEAEKASGSYIRSRQVQFQQTSHPLQARSLQDHSQIKENGITLYSTLDKGSRDTVSRRQIWIL